MQWPQPKDYQIFTFMSLNRYEIFTIGTFYTPNKMWHLPKSAAHRYHHGCTSQDTPHNYSMGHFWQFISIWEIILSNKCLEFIRNSLSKTLPLIFLPDIASFYSTTKLNIDSYSRIWHVLLFDFLFSGNSGYLRMGALIGFT